MSYILDALKKSDQQRQRGATPTLLTAQVTAAAPKQPFFIYYALLAEALLGIGITIGWLHALQAEQPSPATEAIAAKPPSPISRQPAPAFMPAPPAMAGQTAQELPKANSTALKPVPKVASVKPRSHAAAVARAPSAAASVPQKAMPEKSASPADVAQEQRAIPMVELPLQIQQEIPPLAVQLHAYSSNPSERLVNINFRSLREGEYVTPDLRLEQITPDGMIFSFKGYRFQRGIR